MPLAHAKSRALAEANARHREFLLWLGIQKLAARRGSSHLCWPDRQLTPTSLWWSGSAAQAETL